jgi:hypothetical protein
MPFKQGGTVELYASPLSLLAWVRGFFISVQKKL